MLRMFSFKYEIKSKNEIFQLEKVTYISLSSCSNFKVLSTGVNVHPSIACHRSMDDDAVLQLLDENKIINLVNY